MLFFKKSCWTFLHRQGSSYFNRARLNFQAFALQNMKIGTQEGCHGDPKRWVSTLGFANWTVLAIEETLLSMCRSYRAIFFVSIAQLNDRCFCPSEGHKHGVFIQSSINLGDTLLQITCEWKTAQTWFLTSFIQWLRFLVLITWLVKTENTWTEKYYAILCHTS